MKGQDFENAFIDALASYIDNNGLKHATVAQQAWPDEKDPVREWQSNRTKKGKRRRLNIGDAYAMCQYLGISIASLCGAVEVGPFPVVETATQEGRRSDAGSQEKSENLVLYPYANKNTPVRGKN